MPFPLSSTDIPQPTHIISTTLLHTAPLSFTISIPQPIYNTTPTLADLKDRLEKWIKSAPSSPPGSGASTNPPVLPADSSLNTLPGEENDECSPIAKVSSDSLLLSASSPLLTKLVGEYMDTSSQWVVEAVVAATPILLEQSCNPMSSTDHDNIVMAPVAALEFSSLRNPFTQLHNGVSSSHRHYAYEGIDSLGYSTAPCDINWVT